MGNKIFLRGEGGELRTMEESPYGTEDDLQSLLEQHPELLAGDQ